MCAASRREPRGHVRVTSQTDSPILTGTHGYPYCEVSGLPRFSDTPKNASDRIPKLNTRVRFPSSAPYLAGHLSRPNPLVPFRGPVSRRNLPSWRRRIRTWSRSPAGPAEQARDRRSGRWPVTGPAVPALRAGILRLQHDHQRACIHEVCHSSSQVFNQ